MKARLLDAPLAVTSTGRLIAGATHTTGEVKDPKKALDVALASGRCVFVGVVLTEAESRRILRRGDDAFAELIASVPYRDPE